MFERLFEAFGLDLKKNKLDSPQIVKDTYDDGAVEVIDYGGVYYDGYTDVLKAISNERELILLYREISFIPEVDQAVNEIVNDAIVYSKSEHFPVKINLDGVELTDNIKKKIFEEFENILGLLKFDNKADDTFRQWYIDGRMPFYLYVDENKKNNGITKIIAIDPTKIKKIREIKKKMIDGVEKIYDIDEKYIYFPDNNTPVEFVNKPLQSYNISGEMHRGIELTADSVVFSTSGLMDEMRISVLSYLHKAIKPANQLNQMEDAMLIYRISRAPERRVFYVDVGNLPKNKAESYLQSLMARFRNKLSYNASTGKVRNESHIKSILEDFWLPRREGGKGTEISTIGGNTTFAGITEETNYFKQRLYRSLNVPIGRVDPEATFVFGKSGEITRDEIKFSKFINNLRNQFGQTIFDDILKTQLVLKKIIKFNEWETIQKGIFYQWEDDSHFSEMKELETLNLRMETLDLVNNHRDNYFSKGWIRRHVLFQTEEEIKELEKERDKEQETEPEEEPEENKPRPVPVVLQQPDEEDEEDQK